MSEGVSDALSWANQFADGLLVTVKLAISAYVLGILIGSLGATVKFSRNAWLTAAVNAYVMLFRGIPEILAVFLIFYGGGAVLKPLLSSFRDDAPVEISPFVAGVVALALVQGAYATEVLRSAVLAIDKSQLEAALRSA